MVIHNTPKYSRGAAAFQDKKHKKGLDIKNLQKLMEILAKLVEEKAKMRLII
jgi:methyl coenzyme M reductase subunit C-like uncharacterized protein (methanogenesis marker protein 7)